MSPENVANLLGALATIVTDGVVDTVSPSSDTLAERTALALLVKYPDCSIQELREPLALSHSGCVRLVDRLASAGYVKRRIAVDGRAVALRLTRRGRAVAAANTRLRAESLLRLLGALTDHERTLLAQLAKRLLQHGTPTPHAAGKTCRLCDYAACVECPIRERFSPSCGSK